VRLSERLFVASRPDTNHELVLDDSAEHAPLEEEGEPAEHLLFSHVPAVFEGLANTLRERLVIAHGLSGLTTEDRSAQTG